MKRISALCLAVVSATSVEARPQLIVHEQAWSSLSSHERSILQEKQTVSVIASDNLGVIRDAQSVNESTPGSDAGSRLGSAVGSAVYLDKAIDNLDYSAKNHIGALLVGGLIGSALNKPKQISYHFRYSIEKLDGSVVTLDTYDEQPFRKPVGACVVLPDLSEVGRSVCSNSVENLRARISKLSPHQSSLGGSEVVSASAPANTNQKVRCKIGQNTPAILVEASVCNKAKGKILP